jgi:6-deoxyerythronolide B hydroxylase
MSVTDPDTCLIGAVPHQIGPDFGQHPYAFIGSLRDAGPVHRVLLKDGTESWWVTRFAEVRKCLNDHERLSSQVHHAVASKQIQNSQALIRKDDLLHLVMINRDPPDHTRMRNLVQEAFSARSVEKLRPRIEEIVEGLLDQWVSGDRVELVQEYAFPLAVGVICEILGIAYAESARLGSLVTKMVGALRPEEALSAIGDLKQFMAEQVSQKRRHPTDDVLSQLIRAQADGLLTEAELVAMALQLLSAGHETSIFLISGGVFNLLCYPEQVAEVKRDASLLPRAVDEMLRFEPPPVPGVFRHATEDIEIAGNVIPKGSLVILCLAAANREGQRFSCPDTFDVSRNDPAHLSFGAGIHYCLGARLGRLEGVAAIGALLRRFPDLTLAIPSEEVRRRPLNFLQRLSEVPVVLH